MTTEPNNHDRFLGLTKIQFLGGGFIFFAVTTSVLILLLALQVSANRQSADTARDLGQESHQALCAIKANSAAQVKGTEEFLRLNPGPEPIAGISRESLQAQLDRQKNFLLALDVVQGC